MMVVDWMTCPDPGSSKKDPALAGPENRGVKTTKARTKHETRITTNI